MVELNSKKLKLKRKSKIVKRETLKMQGQVREEFIQILNRSKTLRGLVCEKAQDAQGKQAKVSHKKHVSELKTSKTKNFVLLKTLKSSPL